MRAAMSRHKGTASFAALNGMPTITTALRIKPCFEAANRRRRTVPVRGQQASYVFDAVLEAATQQQAYQHLCAPLVDGLLSGQSSVLLLYGASQSGKTYTLHGGSSSQEAGIAVQAVQALARGLSIVPNSKYRLSASYCGLTCGHDAQLMDLLAAAPAAVTSLNNGSAAAALASLSSWTLEEPADILEVLRCRKLQQSSSSGPMKAARALHTMLTLQLDSFDADRNILSSKHLSFVELAAPEPKDPLGMGRNSENATARSLAMTYNSLSKVLLALRNSAPAAAAIPGAAAAALAAGSLTSWQQMQHVPWRDSTLTRWLQERLHTASSIILVGTASSAVEAAADTVATISWVSRFSSSSKTGTGGTLVSFAWEVAADPEATGSYLRFQPDQQVIRGPQTSHVAFVKQQQQRRREQQQAGRDSPIRQRASTPAGGSYCGPAYSSPMVNQCSPNLPNSTAPQSAASISNAIRIESRLQQQLLQQRQHHSADNTPIKRQIDQWQHQQERWQHKAEAAGFGCADPLSSPTAAMLQSGDDVNPVNDTGRVLADEVVLYGELMTVLRRAGGGLRAETILQQLLQELGGTRAALSAEKGELKLLRAELTTLQEQHADCDQAKQLLQDHNRDLQQKLQAERKTLDEASADRDLFLKRLQQLEADADGDGSARSPKKLEMQRQKAHAAQLRTMEAELNALASSNQQLRSQLDLATQQMSRTKLAAQSSADNTEQLQQEVDVLRAAADIEGDIRRELETTVEQLQRACEATAHELATVTAGKAALQQQYEQAQESIDALAAELQDTLAKVDEKESDVQALAEQLDIEQRQNLEAYQQLSALQTQVSALEEATQQQRQQAVEEELMQQQTVEALQKLVQDLQDVFDDFEQDLDTTLPQQWKQLLPTQNTPSKHPGSASPDTKRGRLRSALSYLMTGAGSRHSTSACRTALSRNGAGSAVVSALPYEWAQTLQAVVEVIQLAVDERAQAAEEVQGSVRRAELLDRNVEELRKLVSTQEDLQQQLAVQLAASQQESDAAAAQHAAEQQKLQGSLDEAQTAVTALADELQECQAQLKAAQDNLTERDQALDVLADEFVELSAAQDSLAANKQELEEQVQALAAELEEALLQLSIRDQILDQVWGQLKGLPLYTSNNNDNPDMQGLGNIAVWDDSETNLPKSAALDRLHQQQYQQQWQGQLHQQRRRSILDDGVAAGSTAAGLAQQAVQAARRRSSAGGEGQPLQQPQQQRKPAQGSGLLGRGAGERRSQAEQDGSAHLQDNSRAQWPSSQKRQLQQQGILKQGKQGSQQVQPLVVAAVQRLCSQVVDLHQQLADASAGSIQSSKLQQQLKDLRQQYNELAERSEQQEQDDLLLQNKCRQLGQQLRAKEMEAEQSQERCQELINSLKQVQQHLQQQQQAPPPPRDSTTPSIAQQQAELQLIDCRHQLADLQARLAETSSALAAEKAARLAAEDAEANRQQLLARLGTLQEELSGLHAQLLAERKQVVAVREELALMTTSRDTWRDSAKRAEAAAAAAEEAAESKTTDLTRARAEVHTLKQQLTNTTQQLELLQLQTATHTASELHAADGLAEGLAARLAAAQVMRREAEDRAAELSRKLAAAEQHLDEYKQQQGDEEVELAQQLTVQEAQLARSKADAVTQRAAAEAASAQLAEVTRQLAALQAERDKLQQQVMSMQAQQFKAVLQLPMQPPSMQQLQPRPVQPQSVTSLQGHLQALQQQTVQQQQQLVLPLPAVCQLTPTQQQVPNVQQQQPTQQQQRPSAASTQPWTTMGAPVSYESMVTPEAALIAATGMADGLISMQQAACTQPCQHAPPISSNNPFYQSQTHHAAASKSQAADTLSHAIPANSRQDASAASVSPSSRFLGGFFSSWKHGSSPAAVEAATGGVSTPNAHAGGQQRVTYSSSGGGRSGSAGGGTSRSPNNSGAGGRLLGNSVAGDVLGSGGTNWETATRDGGSQHTAGAHGQDAVESPCLY